MIDVYVLKIQIIASVVKNLFEGQRWRLNLQSGTRLSTSRSTTPFLFSKSALQVKRWTLHWWDLQRKICTVTKAYFILSCFGFKSWDGFLVGEWHCTASSQDALYNVQMQISQSLRMYNPRLCACSIRFGFCYSDGGWAGLSNETFSLNNYFFYMMASLRWWLARPLSASQACMVPLASRFTAMITWASTYTSSHTGSPLAAPQGQETEVFGMLGCDLIF